MAVVRYLVPALAVFAGLTATFGNLAAYLADQPQAAAGLLDHRPRRLHDDGRLRLTTPRLYLPGDQAVVGVQAVLFYLVAYLFMNLGAFAVVAFLRNETGSEDLDRTARPGAALAVDGGDAGVLPAEPAGHAAAGRLHGQVPDLLALWAAGLYYWHAGDRSLGFTLAGPAGGRRHKHRL